MASTCSVRVIILAAFLFSFEAAGQPFTRTCSPTTLSGFYDYQSNWRTPQYIRVNPANGNIHVIFMTSSDSAYISESRGTVYAFTSNSGVTWNNFNNVRVPTRRSGFPTLDLLRGPNAGMPVIASNSSSPLTVFVAWPEGSGAFAELAPTPMMGNDEPIWPEIACPADGSIVLVASRSGACTIHHTRTTDFATWAPWGSLLPLCGGREVLEANESGRVGLAINGGNEGVFLLESTDNGQTWPDTMRIVPPEIVVGPDTFTLGPGIDAVYYGNSILITFGLRKVDTPEKGAIGFWSGATGFVLVVPPDSTPGATASLNRGQVNHTTVAYPAIGMSGQNVVLSFVGMMPETSAAGFNYGDVFFIHSTNLGQTWSRPGNVTLTTSLDERYPSMSKFNSPGHANMVYQEDSQPGSSAFNDNAPVSRSRLIFCRISNFTVSVDERSEWPGEFALYQNYPNPFNPTTTIQFSVGTYGHTSLRVYDLLGREVATLVNEIKEPGTYEAEWDATAHASGVYFYRMTAGPFSSVKKLLLLR